MPHQTQIVVLEGPSLVEHYVAQSGTASLVGNVYVGKVKNVLPGMEAAFVDFGASKNGVVYADDISYDRSIHGRKHPRIEEVLHEGDEVLVQVVRDAMGAKGARLTNQPSLPGRFLVLVPDSDAQGISRRLPDEERTRLRARGGRGETRQHGRHRPHGGRGRQPQRYRGGRHPTGRHLGADTWRRPTAAEPRVCSTKSRNCSFG